MQRLMSSPDGSLALRRARSLVEFVTQMSDVRLHPHDHDLEEKDEDDQPLDAELAPGDSQLEETLAGVLGLVLEDLEPVVERREPPLDEVVVGEEREELALAR